MPLFNRRNKAGIGTGEVSHVGHIDPFAGHEPAPRPAGPHQDPFAPTQSRLQKDLGHLAHEQASQGKKPLDNAGLVKQQLKGKLGQDKTNYPADPFA